MQLIIFFSATSHINIFESDLEIVSPIIYPQCFLKLLY